MSIRLGLDLNTGLGVGLDMRLEIRPWTGYWAWV